LGQRNLGVPFASETVQLKLFSLCEYFWPTGSRPALQVHDQRAHSFLHYLGSFRQMTAAYCVDCGPVYDSELAPVARALQSKLGRRLDRDGSLFWYYKSFCLWGPTSDVALKV
jgi:hypothetical protein